MSSENPQAVRERLQSLLRDTLYFDETEALGTPYIGGIEAAVDALMRFDSLGTHVMPQDIATYPSGASYSPCPRYDLVPPELLEAVTRRFTVGALKHGERNWEKGLDDPAYLRDRANHMLQHAMNYVYGINGEDSPEENLAAVGWAVAVLLRAERRKREQGSDKR